MENEFYPFVNLPLPYAYNALEPFIDQKTMHLHHDKHLQTYIDNLNKILEDSPNLQSMSLEELIKNACRLPQRLQTPVRNNAGGVFNHRFYFEGLANPSTEAPTGQLADAINRQFGGFAQFEAAFQEAALGVFGSGYAWLVSACGNLQILTTPNQNSPIERGFCPILTIDVWEHAYYLKHYNVRADYFNDWKRIINWEKAEQAYNRCLNPCDCRRERR